MARDENVVLGFRQRLLDAQIRIDSATDLVATVGRGFSPEEAKDILAAYTLLTREVHYLTSTIASIASLRSAETRVVVEEGGHLR